MYTMDDVMRVLASDDVNRLVAAAGVYWYATEKLLNFQTCVRHVEILAISTTVIIEMDAGDSWRHRAIIGAVLATLRVSYDKIEMV